MGETECSLLNRAANVWEGQTIIKDCRSVNTLDGIWLGDIPPGIYAVDHTLTGSVRGAGRDKTILRWTGKD